MMMKKLYSDTGEDIAGFKGGFGGEGARGRGLSQELFTVKWSGSHPHLALIKNTQNPSLMLLFLRALNGKIHKSVLCIQG